MRAQILWALLCLVAIQGHAAADIDGAVALSFEGAEATELSLRPSMPNKEEVNQLTTYCYNTTTGERIPNCNITVKVKAVPRSGAHNHAAGARPAGSVSPASGSSGASGLFKFSYTSPEVSGRIEITVIGSKPGYTFSPGVGQFAVEIKGLTIVPLPSADYNLVGSTPTHPSNHFVVPGFHVKLVALARQYKDQFPGSRLNFNDMSLPQGGLFDIKTPWTIPHKEHRIGYNEDLRLVPAAQRAKLELMIKSLGLGILKEEALNHWHLRFDPKGRI